MISLPIAIGSSDIGSQVNSTLKKAMPKMVHCQQANQSQQAKGFEQRVMRLEEEFEQLKPVRTPVAIFGSLEVCIYVPASRHWLISYSPIHLT